MPGEQNVARYFVLSDFADNITTATENYSESLRAAVKGRVDERDRIGIEEGAGVQGPYKNFSGGFCESREDSSLRR